MTDKQKWKRLHDILGFTPPLDGLISGYSNKIKLDVIKLDTLLDNKDPEYNAIKCTYKGLDISPAEYIETKYGEEAKLLIMDLL